MKKIAIILCLALCHTTVLMAQKSRKQQKAEPEPVVNVEEALANYDFRTAEKALEHQIEALRKKKQPTEQQEEQLQYVHQAMQKMNAVERVVFIDSVIVPRNQVIPRLCLSEESGLVCSATEFFGEPDVMDRTVFRSQLCDKVFFPKADAQNILRLMQQDLTADDSSAQLLAGLSDEGDDIQNYPFMMTDGSTFYFAAQSSESLGGYDIFMSRYDADEHRFLAPENIGMPFNSPANDYLFVIDEFYNIGCFVTDRGMEPDNVCIYYFIPNETRRVYVEEEVGEEALRSLARIESIRDTWTNEMQVRLAQKNLRECLLTEKDADLYNFTFIVADNKICHFIDDFRSPKAQELIQLWIGWQSELQKTTEQLDALRLSYAEKKQANAKSQILALEQRQEQLILQIKKSEKDIRKAELGL